MFISNKNKQKIVDEINQLCNLLNKLTLEVGGLEKDLKWVQSGNFKEPVSEYSVILYLYRHLKAIEEFLEV